MSLKFYNTLTKEVDEFIPLTYGRATIYTCGPTVYDYLHVGNWAAYIYWDTLVRILKANNFEINRVLNITDVGHLTSDTDEGEDKLEKGAKRERKTAQEIADFYTKDFLFGMEKLNLLPAEHLAPATKFINQQLELIRQLKEKGLTYQIDDGIYFDTAKFPTYAEFANLDLSALQAGARIKFNPQKRNPSDFALWKFVSQGQKRDMEWETPADLLENNSDTKIMGFPGWHLECSAIALSLLGNTIDIHTGGIDHIPTHHTNEIAQSEAVTGVKFCNYWLHCNHLKIDDKKISKSLGNGYTLQDLDSKGFSPLDFRMFVLQGHYRNEGNFTFEALSAAQNRLHNWRNIAVLRHQTHDTLISGQERSNKDKVIPLYAVSQAITEAINNDLGTPQALKIIDNAFSKLIDTPKLENIDRRALVELLETIDRLLGLKLLETTPDISDDDKRILQERKIARAEKSWKKSDKLRSQLEKSKIVLRDTIFDTIWEYAD